MDYAQVQAYMGVSAAGQAPQSEDCLFLNVFVPAASNGSSARRCDPPRCNVCAQCCHAWIAPGKDCDECFRASCNGTADAGAGTEVEQHSRRLPVLLWIHGGAYEGGTGSSYNGSAFIEAAAGSGGEPVIVVTTNYRLNVFGFLGSAELANSSSDGSTGNFGLQDQRLGNLCRFRLCCCRCVAHSRWIVDRQR